MESVGPAARDPGGCGPEYVLAPDVLVVPVLDGSVRLLDMAGCFYGVGEVGAEMLRAALARGAEAASAELAEKYGVEQGQVRADLLAFLAELEKNGLIRARQARRSSRGLGAFLARVLLTPALCLPALVPSRKAKVWLLLALARLSFALFGWTRVLGVWERAYRPRRGLLPDDEAKEVVRTLDEVVRPVAARHLLTVECKERALCCWALARRAGVSASLVVGVQLYPLVVHCWCEFGPHTFSDDPERCATFQPVVRYA